MMKLLEQLIDDGLSAESAAGDLAAEQEQREKRGQAYQKLESTFAQMCADGNLDGKEVAQLMKEFRAQGLDTKTLQDIPPAGTMRRIPKSMYLMEGDNRAHSCDSRVWGLVPRSAIIGKVFLTYWPLGRIGVP
jgi:signal peptidase I